MNDKESLGQSTHKQQSKIEDCLGCKIVGSGGSLGIATYLYVNARKHPDLKNKVFINLLGAGIH